MHAVATLKGHNNWQHAHNVMVDILNMCCNKCETLSVVVNAENRNKGELKKKYSVLHQASLKIDNVKMNYNLFNTFCSK